MVYRYLYSASHGEAFSAFQFQEKVRLKGERKTSKGEQGELAIENEEGGDSRVTDQYMEKQRT